MLNLLVFAPCERVIISDEKTTSLITLLEVMNMGVTAEQAASIAQETAIPFTWHVLALWRPESEDDLGAYVQRLTIIPPDDMPPTEFLLDFEVTRIDRNVRAKIGVNGFPIPHRAGICRLKIELRKNDDKAEWREYTQYPVVVRFKEAAEPEETVESKE